METLVDNDVYLISNTYWPITRQVNPIKSLSLYRHSLCNYGTNKSHICAAANVVIPIAPPQPLLATTRMHVSMGIAISTRQAGNSIYTCVPG